MKTETLIERTKGAISLTRSEINTIIAGMLLCNVRYDSMGSTEEAEKYRTIEYKLRDLFYNGDEVSEGTLCKKDNYDSLLENLKRIIDRIEENNLHFKHFPSAYNRAKEAIKKAEGNE